MTLARVIRPVRPEVHCWARALSHEPPSGVLGFNLEGNQPVGRLVPKPPPAGREVRAQVKAQETTYAQLPPLADVLLLVSKESGAIRSPAPDGDQRAEGDGVRTGRDRSADPEPVVAPALDAHYAASQYRREASARR